MNVVFSGKVENGKLKIWDEQSLRDEITRLEGNPVVLILKRGNLRSTRQNAWLWGVAYKLLAEYTGYTEEQIHAYCKAKFNPVTVEIVNKTTGEIDSMVVGNTTTQMTTTEFNDYKERIQQLGAELDCVIPDPGDAKK